MRRGTVMAVLLTMGILTLTGGLAGAGTPGTAVDATPTPTPTRKPPVFVGWLRPDDPGDQVIKVYWKKVEAGTATPQELIDLGTMLFYRGYPKDAVRMYKRALDQDDTLAEAWFRIGTVYHAQRKLTKARKAYHKSIKRFPGHGWCNFFLGLCDEELGYTEEAIHYYRRAYRFAPELMDPDVNPAVLYSRIQVSARVPTLMERLVKRQLPLDYLEKEKVEAVRSRFEPTPTPPPPTPTPEKTAGTTRRRATPPQRPASAKPAAVVPKPMKQSGRGPAAAQQVTPRPPTARTAPKVYSRPPAHQAPRSLRPIKPKAMKVVPPAGTPAPTPTPAPAS